MHAEHHAVVQAKQPYNVHFIWICYHFAIF